MPDPILLWNEVALEANRVSHSNGQGEQTGPTLSSRALGIVHLAMYDACAGIVNDNSKMPRYIAAPSSPTTTGSQDAAIAAAVASAAYKTLAALYPSQIPLFDSIFAASSDPGQSAAHTFGEEVADEILKDRKADPGSGSTTYKPSPARGKHRPDPDNAGQGFHAPDYGKKSKGFAIGARHELAPPPFGDGSDADYGRALKEVRGKGIKPELMGTLPDSIEGRTVDETLTGIYWGYDGALGLGTPPRLYNQILRVVVRQQSPGDPEVPNTTVENAQLFALVNVAMADAGILAWDQKYLHDFWRPVVGIREHDKSMGPGDRVGDDNISDDCDPLWLPLGGPNTNRPAKNFTPNFPAYPSGHATFGAAAFHIARLFYNKGGRFNFGTSAGGNLTPDSLFEDHVFVSEEFNGINTDNAGAVRPRHVRSFPDGLWQMIEENGRSRVYLGVHWVFDAFAVDEDDELDLDRAESSKPIGGVPLGLIIAEDIFDRFENAKTSGQPAWKSTVEPRPEEAMAVLEDRAETFGSSFQPAAQAR